LILLLSRRCLHRTPHHRPSCRLPSFRWRSCRRRKLRIWRRLKFRCHPSRLFLDLRRTK